MAYMDEIDIGDKCIVTDLRKGKQFKGEIVEKRFGAPPIPGTMPRPDLDKVVVRYEDGELVSVGPAFVTLEVGE